VQREVGRAGEELLIVIARPPPFFPDYYHFYEAKLCLCKFILLMLCSQRTPLHYYAERGHAEIVRLLLQHNADVQAKTRE
jgi:ankyrin repeat protein